MTPETRLAAVLHNLTRDCVAWGHIEKILMEIEVGEAAGNDEINFEEPHQEAWARSVAKRILEGDE